MPFPLSNALSLLTLGAVAFLPEDVGNWDPAIARDDLQPEVSPALPEAPPPAPTPPSPAPTPPSPAAVAAPAPQPPPRGETLRYKVAYGILGELGEIKIAYRYPGQDASKVQASGSGAGSLFGLGKIEKRVESELGPGVVTSRRWVATRVQGGKIITDTAEQPAPGDVAVVRRRNDRPQEGHRFTREAPVLDPLAFLWRLRRDPPRARTTFEILDGRALWQIAVQPARVEAEGRRRVFILSGRAEPIFWDGRRDEDRSARNFTLYLEGNADRTPLRLVMPLSVGEVRVDLVGISHPAPATVARPTPPPRLVEKRD